VKKPDQGDKNEEGSDMGAASQGRQLGGRRSGWVK